MSDVKKKETPDNSSDTSASGDAKPAEQAADHKPGDSPASGDAQPAEQAADETSEAEQEMLAALEESENKEANEASPSAASAQEEAATVQVRSVDMDPVKPGPTGTPDPDANLNLILDIPVELKVEIGNSRLTIREVLNLAPGSIIELDRTAGSPADLIVNGARVGQGDVVVVDESYGIRISKLVDPQERLNSL